MVHRDTHGIVFRVTLPDQIRFLLAELSTCLFAGLDFAHAMNGYVYHTSYDDLDAIPAGTLQHTGDNLLALTKHLASSDILSNSQEHAAGRTVYFDVLGLYMITYSEITGIIVNAFIVALSVYTVTKNMVTIKSGNIVIYCYVMCRTVIYIGRRECCFEIVRSPNGDLLDVCSAPGVIKIIQYQGG